MYKGVCLVSCYDPHAVLSERLKDIRFATDNNIDIIQTFKMMYCSDGSPDESYPIQVVHTLREYNHFKNKEKIQYILVSRSILDELETNTANDFLDELEGLGIAVKLM